MREYILALVLLSLVGCAPPAARLKPDKVIWKQQNQKMLESIESLGQNGDWLVIRGYKTADDFISNVTNAPGSHAAVLDLENRNVIESDATGVHVTKLEKFIQKAHRLILIRPIWAELGAEKAINKARGLIGKKYDYSGLVGMDNPERYYCSELALKIYRDFQRKEHQIPMVIEPAHLYLWGTILYDSRPRHWNL